MSDEKKSIWPMTDVQIAAIRERSDKATPGPWGIFRECGGRKRFGIATQKSLDDDDAGELDAIVDYEGRDSGILKEANAEFIAHARQDIPDLLAEAERLRAENEVLEEALDSLGDFIRYQLDYCAGDFVGEGIDYAPCKLEDNPEEDNYRCLVNCWAEAFKRQAEKYVRAMKELERESHE